MLQANGWHAFLDARDLNTNNLVIRVAIKNDARLDLGGFNDLRIVEPQVERVWFLVVAHFHSLPRRLTL